MFVYGRANEEFKLVIIESYYSCRLTFSLTMARGDLETLSASSQEKNCIKRRSHVYRKFPIWLRLT